jgi:hypothetical protein
MKRTPLADTLTVAAENSSSSVESTTGKLKGNRTAQRTSCRVTPPVLAGETGNSVVGGFIDAKSFLVAFSQLYLKKGKVGGALGTLKFLSLHPTLICKLIQENTS